MLGSLTPIMIAGGLAKAYNDEVDEKKAQVAEINAVKREWLLKTGLSNIETRRTQLKEARARISNAKKLGFSTKAARALEMSGQLEFEMEKVTKLIGSNKLSENYIPTLSAYLEGQVENDEDLAKAVSKGLSGESFATEEEMSLGLINAMDDINKLQEQFLKTTDLGGATGLPAFQYTPTKGARIELSDRKSIQTQLATSLNTMYEDSFSIGPSGDVQFNQNADPEVQVLFNNLTEKTVGLAEDPTNTFSPVSALNTVISSIENSSLVPPSVVLDKLDEAITTPSFNWEPFRINPRTDNNNGNQNNNNNNSPVNDI
jgi:hypothetical protein